MGSGKSTLGKQLAKLLQVNFLDLDSVIEENEKKTISSLFESGGEEGFRKIETKHLKKILKIKEPGVISLGGGTICFGNNLKLVKESGLLVYIELPPNELAKRIATSGNNRPLLNNLEGSELTSEIEKKLKERRKYYEQARLKIDGINLGSEKLLEKIIECV